MASVAVADHGLDPDQLTQVEDAILELAKQGNMDLTRMADALAPVLDPPVETKKLVAVFNGLLRKGRVVLRRDKHGKTVYDCLSADEAKKFMGLGVEDRLVLSLVKDASNMGIWAKDLRTKSGLQLNQFTKVLKTLEGRQLIKSVKSVKAKNKKFYMLFEIEPSAELAGGPWFSDQKELDLDFIYALQQALVHYMADVGAPILAKQAAEYIASSQISKEVLDEQHIKDLLDVLVYDGQVERNAILNPEEAMDLADEDREDHPEYLYSLAKRHTGPATCTEMPCGVCPVEHLCTPGGDVSPRRCPYMKEWLDMF
ncbi:DNA-directed RNA polymerase III subunit RPC6 [Porphyridium purpureum]|uniref:DNA-directed RNA polymerase III subunit RPC6 n=1 Tax=Porphyridium purpureum TaxID=35688 RepID=A0A5J4YYI1_PORPP|nr:DNA-directed RNA polymerase III subunit RPC6 [Porphyridium purpureum]|eukprot:POR6853..scf209_3